MLAESKGGRRLSKSKKKELLQKVEKLCRDYLVLIQGDTTPTNFENIYAETAFQKLRSELLNILGNDKLELELGKIFRRVEKDKKRECQVVREARKRAVALLSTPYVVIRQNPVGHGGFHTGTLGSDLYQLRWVYDCGSWKNNKKLAECIQALGRRVPTDARIHLLFVSHFDADHVSGLKTLLEAFRNRVDVVVVPYLTSDDMLSVLGRALIARRCPLDFIEQLIDPRTWFRQYGVKHVIRLQPPPPAQPGGAEGPDTPRAPDPGSISKKIVPSEQPQPVVLKPDGNELRGTVAPAGTVVGINTNVGWTDWWFIPFVHPITKSAKRRFSRVAKGLINRSAKGRTFHARLLNLLKTQAGRRLLKEQYQLQKIGDANAISLSLYEGPRLVLPQARISYRGTTESNSTRTGWLLTGDAKLEQYDRRSKWLEFFQPFRNGIGKLMLPHHGSIHNFHPEVLDAANIKAQLFVTADARDKTRPNKGVKDAAQQRRIQKVSDWRGSAILQISGPRIQSKDRPNLSSW
jgi:hypothetical protein